MINIPDTICFGYVFTKNLQSWVPISKVVALGDTPKELKGYEKFTENYHNIKEFDNIPLPGFLLRKGSTFGVDEKWEIVDPRGYLTPISTKNVANLCGCTNMIDGLIQERCVWIRHDDKIELELCSIRSVDYDMAHINSKLLESRIKISDINIGDEILLQNGNSGIYMGVMSLYGSFIETNITKQALPQTFLRRYVLKTGVDTYYHSNEFKILAILNKSTQLFLQADMIKDINFQINSKGISFTSPGYTSSVNYGSYGFIRYVSSISRSKSKVQLTFEEVDRTEADRLLLESFLNSDIGMLMLENKKQTKFLINVPLYNSSSCKTPSFNVLEIDRDLLKMKDIRYGQWYYSGFPTTDTLDNFVKFYKIVKHVKDDFYI